MTYGADAPGELVNLSEKFYYLMDDYCKDDYKDEEEFRAKLKEVYEKIKNYDFKQQS